MRTTDSGVELFTSEDDRQKHLDKSGEDDARDFDGECDEQERSLCFSCCNAPRDGDCAKSGWELLPEPTTNCDLYYKDHDEEYVADCPHCNPHKHNEETKLTVGELKKVLETISDDHVVHIGWKGTIAPAYLCAVWSEDMVNLGAVKILISHRISGDMFE